MSLVDRLKRRVKRTLDRFSGEHSEAAPEQIIPFERNVEADPTREIVRPRLNRPTGGGGEEG